jgi:hypothetical protein
MFSSFKALRWPRSRHLELRSDSLCFTHRNCMLTRHVVGSCLIDCWSCFSSSPSCRSTTITFKSFSRRSDVSQHLTRHTKATLVERHEYSSSLVLYQSNETILRSPYRRKHFSFVFRSMITLFCWNITEQLFQQSHISLSTNVETSFSRCNDIRRGHTSDRLHRRSRAQRHRCTWTSRHVQGDVFNSLVLDRESKRLSISTLVVLK